MELTNYSNDELIDLFEERIKHDHYCPATCRHSVNFITDDIKEEILNRLKHDKHK